jgi:hypothetical protein
MYSDYRMAAGSIFGVSLLPAAAAILNDSNSHSASSFVYNVTQPITAAAASTSGGRESTWDGVITAALAATIPADAAAADTASTRVKQLQRTHHTPSQQAHSQQQRITAAGAVAGVHGTGVSANGNNRSSHLNSSNNGTARSAVNDPVHDFLAGLPDLSHLLPPLTAKVK